MRLKQVTVQLFRNFVAAQTFDVEDDVTILVGKNESGKTTVLKALHRLNPANKVDTKFDLTVEYPRWRLSPDRRKNPDIDATKPIEAVFELTDADLATLSDDLPCALPEGTTCLASRAYDGSYAVELSADLDSIFRCAAAAADLDSGDLTPLLDAESLTAAAAAARAASKELKATSGTASRGKSLSAFAGLVSKYGFLVPGGELDEDQEVAVWERVPKFFYFSEYDKLPGESDLTALAAKLESGERLRASEATVVALLAHADEQPEDFLDDSYDSRKAELQSASFDLSKRVFNYWTQNTDLTVIFDTDNVAVESLPNGGDVTHRFLKIELRDARHGDVETNFATRSAGFQWFFSFFAAFSAYQESSEPVVVLLDEPGTSLHGEAQRDFVRFISAELAGSKQTLYTTHSQFMVDPAHYEKLRAVHDRATRDDPDKGVEITTVSLSADRDTILPVESALGYSVSQHLFLGGGPHLAVEGSSDYLYLQRVSEYLSANGRTGLDPRFSMIPVGGSGNMPAFVALLGRRLQVSALIDGAKSNRTYDRVKSAADNNGSNNSAIVLCADADSDLPRDADIEDLMTVGDYLRLFNWAYSENLQASELSDAKVRLLRRLEDIHGSFDHALPAHALTEHQSEFFADVAPQTLDRFEALFRLINATAT